MSVLKTSNCLRSDCCPLCGSSDIRCIGELNYEKPTTFSSIEIELDRIPELWRCQQCGSAFVQNTVAEDTARSLYSMGQAGERWSSQAFEEEKTEKVVRRMAEIFKCGGSVLDVGCNTGELLDFAHGFGCVTSGVEFSSASREVLQRKGHRVYSSLEDAPGKYDVITAFDVIEHLYDVSFFLRACAEKLAENGRLVLLTGSIDCLSAKLSGRLWWYAQYPEHIVFPSKNTFQIARGWKSKNGFRAMHPDFLSARYTLDAKIC